jgi:hypothetical protein
MIGHHILWVVLPIAIVLAFLVLTAWYLGPTLDFPPFYARP